LIQFDPSKIRQKAQRDEWGVPSERGDSPCRSCHFLAVWYLGDRYLPEHHWLRKWTVATLKHRGPLETARIIGFVLLMFALAVLAIALA
jgi:hypothetical protein